MKNFMSTLVPVQGEEQDAPVVPENEGEPYLSSETPKGLNGDARKGPEKTVLSAGLTINGNLTTDSDIDIYGTVKGNVTTSGKMLLAGSVEGEVSARELYFSKATLKGNVTAKELVVFEDESKVEGNINTRDFILDGKLTGNVYASGSVNLKNKAVLIGDIETSSLEIARGAVYNGKITFINDKEN